MPTINDVHQQFADFFRADDLKPYLYALSQKMSEGHICIDVDDIDVESLPEYYQSTDVQKAMLEHHTLVTTQNDYKPFVLHQNKLYMQRYFHYESILLQKMQEMLATPTDKIESRKAALQSIQPFIQQLFKDNIATGPDWQLTAAIIAVLYNFVIITGGPGTGKTTTVAKILAILFHLYPDMKVALAAPTGKAAARMAESLTQTKMEVPDVVKQKFHQLQPATIHRLLGWKEGSPFFKHNEDNPLAFDLIIVDESSMIDVAMFAKLLQAITPDTRIILLGDKDQLASVEAGSLFGDLCKAPGRLNVFNKATLPFINQFIEKDAQQLGREYEDEHSHHPLFQHIVELRYSHRFKDEQAIGILSKAVIQNNEALLVELLEQSSTDEVQIDTTYDNHIFEQFIAGYEIMCKDTTPSDNSIINALHQLNSLRILCATREGEQGVQRLNLRVEAHLAKKKLIQLDAEFYEHRPIMVTQNNYTLDLYNGDTGILRKDEQGVMRAWFLTNDASGKTTLKSVLPGFITKMETVFAMTIHKSQGSEFDQALVILPPQVKQHLITRELLYTGITRAKKKVIIQSTAATLLEASKAFVERGSGVIDRLRNND